MRAAILGAAGLLAATAGAGLTFNSSESLPRGIYRVRPLYGAPKRGDVVGVCLQGPSAELALARGYVHPQGLEPWIYGVRCASGLAVIGKEVAGVPGDTIETSAAGVWVNGRLLARSGSVEVDSRGREVPHPPFGRRVLGADEYWLQSEYTWRSFDSRVFGVVERAEIVDERMRLGACHPELTCRKTPLNYASGRGAWNCRHLSQTSVPGGIVTN